MAAASVTGVARLHAIIIESAHACHPEAAS